MTQQNKLHYNVQPMNIGKSNSMLSDRILSLRGWAVTSYILIEETRVCECCESEYTAPAMTPRVEITNVRTKARQTLPINELKDLYHQLSLAIEQEFKFPLLPRKVKQVYISISHCSKCFTPFETEQDDLFRKEQPLTISDILTLIEKREIDEMTNIEALEVLLGKRTIRGNIKGSKAGNSNKKKEVKPLDLSTF